ncbi:hypothetical protein C7974DRAFT_379234 [Boeremia exigua]|uniref:uncharacterized protein n=1 Tax=Boeremia exigua TaxID=749465 RepID=UPI001E8E8E46|nr:uncharacterized protein C7974DRAFT_379234 [Boeremia exigua]KAH6616300.1 hypothetical protein C7974DRAFT_379234 [Boeremia exigua]
MQGDIITDVVCRAAGAGVSACEIEFACTRRAESKEVCIARVGCNSCRKLFFRRKMGEDQTVTEEEGALGREQATRRDPRFDHSSAERSCWRAGMSPTNRTACTIPNNSARDSSGLRKFVHEDCMLSTGLSHRVAGLRGQHLVIVAENGTISRAAECHQPLETEGHPHVCAELPHFQTQQSQTVELGREIGQQEVRMRRHAAGSPNPAGRNGQGSESMDGQPFARHGFLVGAIARPDPSAPAAFLIKLDISRTNRARKYGLTKQFRCQVHLQGGSTPRRVRACVDVTSCTTLASTLRPVITATRTSAASTNLGSLNLVILLCLGHLFRMQDGWGSVQQGPRVGTRDTTMVYEEAGSYPSLSPLNITDSEKLLMS